MLTEFHNEELLSFRDPVVCKRMADALDLVRKDTGRDWPLMIGGREVTTGSWIESRNPCEPGTILGRAAAATKAEAESAVEAAWSAWADWSRWQPAERARVLLKVASLLRARKLLFSAVLVL